MRTALILVFLALFTLATPAVSRATPTLEDIRQGAAYSQNLNVLIAGFSKIYEDTTGYDGLADAVITGQMNEEDAKRNVQELSSQLRARHGELSSNLAATPQAPAVSDDAVRRTLANTLQMAESSRDVSLEAIEAGERLVEAARRGDQDFYVQRTVKNLQLTKAQIANQSLLYQQQIDVETGPTVSFYLYSSMKVEADIIVALLGSQIDVALGKPLDPQAFVAPRDLIASGRSHVINGRAAYDTMVATLKGMTAPSPSDDANRTIVLDALSNIPASLDVEANLLDALESYMGGIEAGTFDDAAIAAFQQSVSALESQRMQLQIERQQKLQALQGG